MTVILSQGAIEVKTVGRAMETGTYGQTIRVRNEATRDILEVVVTGPQTAQLGSNMRRKGGDAPLASVRD